MRIALNDADLDRSAGALNALQPALTGVAGRMTPGLSSGAPPAIKGQVDAAVGEARAMVLGVSTRVPGRAQELRRRAIFARVAAGDIRVSDLRTLSAWEEERMKKVGSPRSARAVEQDGGFLGLGGLFDAIGDAASKHGGKALDGTQLGLDALGLIPGLGEPADGVNGLIYGLRGDETNAALSLAGMVPFLGWGATGGKWANKINHAADAGGGAGGAAKKVETPNQRVQRVKKARNMLVSPKAERHILDGEKYWSPNKGGWVHKGGHRAPGQPGKSLFPSDWSDEKILDTVAEIASRHEKLSPISVPPQKLREIVDTVDGVQIKLWVHSDGRVDTAYPLNGSKSHVPEGPPPPPKATP